MCLLFIIMYAYTATVAAVIRSNASETRCDANRQQAIAPRPIQTLVLMHTVDFRNLIVLLWAETLAH